jgi:hypothetical protein
VRLARLGRLRAEPAAALRRVGRSRPPGWTCCVDQGHYGHMAGKPTWLLAAALESLPELRWGKGEQRLHPVALAKHGYAKARRIGMLSMIGGKDKTRIRNTTPRRADCDGPERLRRPYRFWLTGWKEEDEMISSDANAKVADAGATPEQPSAGIYKALPSSKIAHGNWWIEYDPPPIPLRQFDWAYWHNEYDGPEDSRHGHAASLEAAKAEIDAWEEEHAPPEGWQAAQGSKCDCRGADDMCPCQNVYSPASYGLQESEQCGVCGSLPAEGLYRFCRRPDCPIPEHLEASREARLLAYQHAHETAVELGYPSITEALEALADGALSRHDPSSAQHGGA